MAKTTKKSGYTLVTKPGQKTIQQALGISDSREKQIEKFVIRAIKMSKKSEAMNYLAGRARNLEEFAYMQCSYGIELSRPTCDHEHAKELFGMLLGRPEPQPRKNTWNDNLFAFGMGLWIVYVLIGILEFFIK